MFNLWLTEQKLSASRHVSFNHRKDIFSVALLAGQSQQMSVYSKGNFFFSGENSLNRREQPYADYALLNRWRREGSTTTGIGTGQFSNYISFKFKAISQNQFTYRMRDKAESSHQNHSQTQRCKSVFVSSMIFKKSFNRMGVKRRKKPNFLHNFKCSWHLRFLGNDDSK